MVTSFVESNSRDPLKTSIAYPKMHFLDEAIVDTTFALTIMSSTSILYHIQSPNVLETSPSWAPKLQPSIMSPLKLEMKPLPVSLKYAYLGDDETLPIVLSSKLSTCEEDKLLAVLREHKAVFG